MVSDKYAYAARMAQIALNEMGGIVFGGEPLLLAEIEFLTKGSTKGSSQSLGSWEKELPLSNQQKLELECLLSLPNFKNLDDHLGAHTSEWREWMTNLSQHEDEKKGIQMYCQFLDGNVPRAKN
eukprot:TRINITY_DN754_c0_g1_i1.p2 TRINITY_DN754_c0_g1~~TRINITY_DN754_c0_g1_i1.p2  ORF type:complete len:124 (-),score=26.78 TRINITY_DN754_c0_g1_i1:930-1301(-)